jgi:hypothetical protein
LLLILHPFTFASIQCCRLWHTCSRLKQLKFARIYFIPPSSGWATHHIWGGARQCVPKCVHNRTALPLYSRLQIRLLQLLLSTPPLFDKPQGKEQVGCGSKSQSSHQTSSAGGLHSSCLVGCFIRRCDKCGPILVCHSCRGYPGRRGCYSDSGC